MVTKIQKWGNSQGLRLPKQVLEDARIAVGDDVDVTARDGMIVIAPARLIEGVGPREGSEIGSNSAGLTP